MFAVLDIESSTKEDVKDRETFIKILETVTKSIKQEVCGERPAHPWPLARRYV